MIDWLNGYSWSACWARAAICVTVLNIVFAFCFGSWKPAPWIEWLLKKP